MAISKRPGRPQPWLARFRGPDGTERSKAFRRKVDAERWLASQEVDQLRGQWTDPRLAETTFAEWVPTYTAARVHLAPSTRATAESLMRGHVLTYFGPRALGSFTQTDVQAFVSGLQSAGLSPSTIRQCYLLAAGVFGSAVDSDLIARSPCRGINLPKADQEEMRFLTGDEVEALVAAVDSSYAALVSTAAYTGARFGELAAVQVSRLNLLRGTLTVAEQVSEVKGQVRIRPPKTAASRRQIALPGSCVISSASTWPAIRRSTGSCSPRPTVSYSVAPTSGVGPSCRRCGSRWGSRCGFMTCAIPMWRCSSPRESTRR